MATHILVFMHKDGQRLAGLGRRQSAATALGLGRRRTALTNRRTGFVKYWVWDDPASGAYPFGDPHGWLPPMTFIKIAAS